MKIRNKITGEIAYIDDSKQLYPCIINSNKVSAQNRLRLYWSNIRTKETGLFRELLTDISEPEDRGILLKDILQPESEIDARYYLSDKMLQYFINRADNFNNGKVNFRHPDGKLSTITASSKSCDISDNFIIVDKKGFLKTNTNKSSCLTGGGNSGGNHSDMDLLLYAIGDKISIRRLTPIECSRLQTIPEWYKWECSDTQQYKMLGNGWTVEVIKHIFSFINVDY